MTTEMIKYLAKLCLSILPSFCYYRLKIMQVEVKVKTKGNTNLDFSSFLSTSTLTCLLLCFIRRPLPVLHYDGDIALEPEAVVVIRKN